MTNSGLTRRRTITIMAATGAAALVAAPVARSRHEWRGTALGAEGRLIFEGIDRRTADRLTALVIAEIDRLEQVFSLYRPNSQISRLNQQARFDFPSHDLQTVLASGLDFWRRSDGAFNPAIQPFWHMLSKHFAGRPMRSDPHRRQISAALDLCNPEHILLSPEAIKLKPGMALTLNGIAQGYITDQIVALLHQNGLSNTLVQLGETRTLPGRSWQVEIAATGRSIELADSAIATSAGSGTTFSKDGRWHHLIDPKSGYSGLDFNSITVCGPSAMLADALSTALSVAGRQNLSRIAGRFPQVRVFCEDDDGDILELSA